MPNVLIVSETKSRLVVAIKDRLLCAHYDVIELPADIDAIYGVKEHLCGILIYADEQLIEQQQALNFLKDRAITDDIPVFTAGKPENLDAIKIMIPKSLIRLEFARPLNVNALADEIDTFMRQYSMISKKKILVVDDSGAMLRTVKEWLEDKYNVSLVSSSAMAIKYLSLNRPDLILLDYDMPVCDGRQMLEMIRAETDFQDVPVIFLTNKSDKESIMNVKSLNPEGYLLKSMEPAQIIQAVDNFFEARKGLM